MRTPQYFVQCAGTRPQGFVLLRTSVRCEPKRALCGANPQGCSTVCWYSPTRAWYPMLMCSCGSVRSEPARACASVYGASLKSYVRREPTKASYSVLVLSPQGFAPSQCFCVRYEPQGLCAVRAYKGFIQCAGALPSGLCTQSVLMCRCGQ